MELYSVLLVDDEEDVLSVIQHKLNWEEMGFFVCGTAANGMEALEIVNRTPPDVIVSDIRMPYMDGLELAGQVYSLYPDIRIIIISGFDDFELAKRAISLGVRDYLLKPIDIAELRQLFEKTKIQLDEERLRQNSIERLEEYYRNSLPILRESFLISLVEGNLDKSKITQSLKEYGIHLTGPYYVVAVIHLSAADSYGEILDSRLVSISIREQAEERIVHDKKSLMFTYRDEIVAITQLTQMEEVSEYTDECDRFAMQMQRMNNAVVTIGIGKVADKLSEICTSYHSAKEALSCRAFYGRGTAINIAEIGPTDSFDDTVQMECFNRILREIKLGGPNEVEQAVDAYVHALMECRPDPKQFRLLMMELLTGLYRFMDHNEIYLGKLDISEEDIYAKLLKIDSAEELKLWLNGISQKIQSSLLEQRSNVSRSFVEKAKDFVQERYSDSELTIHMVCKELGVSAAYFSTVFKKETGQTFVTYLTDYRMKEAIRMMVEQNEKTYIIAEKVGYSDANYFSYVFKKQFGMSPTKYKKQRSSD